MKHNTIIYLFILAIGMAASGCATKKMANSTPAPTPAVSQPAWHTVQVREAMGRITFGNKEYAADINTACTRDSMLTISIMPILGIELVRVEATPEQVKIIDKINRQYLSLTYEEANRVITPAIQWKDLQDLASGDMLQKGNDTYRIAYSAQGKTIELSIRYLKIEKDVELRLRSTNTKLYQTIDTDNLLNN